MPENSSDPAKAYWQANIRIVLSLLAVWFFISFGCGILFVDALDTIRFGGFKLGFWIAQQGSIIVFVVLIFVYIYLMDRLDEKFASYDSSSKVSQEEEEA